MTRLHFRYLGISCLLLSVALVVVAATRWQDARRVAAFSTSFRDSVDSAVIGIVENPTLKVLAPDEETFRQPTWCADVTSGAAKLESLTAELEHGSVPSDCLRLVGNYAQAMKAICTAMKAAASQAEQGNREQSAYLAKQAEADEHNRQAFSLSRAYAETKWDRLRNDEKAERVATQLATKEATQHLQTAQEAYAAAGKQLKDAATHYARAKDSGRRLGQVFASPKHPGLILLMGLLLTPAGFAALHRSDPQLTAACFAALVNLREWLRYNVKLTKCGLCGVSYGFHEHECDPEARERYQTHLEQQRIQSQARQQEQQWQQQQQGHQQQQRQFSGLPGANVNCPRCGSMDTVVKTDQPGCGAFLFVFFLIIFSNCCLPFIGMIIVFALYMLYSQQQQISSRRYVCRACQWQWK